MKSRSLPPLRRGIVESRSISRTISAADDPRYVIELNQKIIAFFNLYGF